MIALICVETGRDLSARGARVSVPKTRGTRQVVVLKSVELDEDCVAKPHLFGLARSLRLKQSVEADSGQIKRPQESIEPVQSV